MDTAIGPTYSDNVVRSVAGWTSTPTPGGSIWVAEVIYKYQLDDPNSDIWNTADNFGPGQSDTVGAWMWRPISTVPEPSTWAMLILGFGGLRGHDDPGTVFVRTVKSGKKSAAYDMSSFYAAWRLAIQRYGIYNPYTGLGAIEGLLPHGPHNVRDVLATHVLKHTGSYELAGFAVHDTPEVVRQHYCRFLPEEKTALAAKVLNKVWEAR